jgi:predicted MPP superfamily phosphohydrolase
VRFGLIVLIAVVGIHLAEAFTRGKTVEYKEVPFTSSAVPADLDGYRIAFVSDTHTMPLDEIAQVAERLNGLDLDLLILGGDFTWTSVPRDELATLADVTTTDGVYAVGGNHDDHPDYFTALHELGIGVLANSGAQVRSDLYLAGVTDLIQGTNGGKGRIRVGGVGPRSEEEVTAEASSYFAPPAIAQATAGADADQFVLLVSHNPDVTMQQDTTAADLIVSGHTHGGQITLFGLWAPVLAHSDYATAYGQRFMSGWAESADGVPVYMSNGVGPFGDVPRVFAPPQVIIITLGL